MATVIADDRHPKLTRNEPTRYLCPTRIAKHPYTEVFCCLPDRELVVHTSKSDLQLLEVTELCHKSVQALKLHSSSQTTSWKWWQVQPQKLPQGASLIYIGKLNGHVKWKRRKLLAGEIFQQYWLRSSLKASKSLAQSTMHLFPNETKLTTQKVANKS